MNPLTEKAPLLHPEPADQGKSRGIPREVRECIKKRAREFDIYGLMELLHHHGYQLTDVDMIGYQGLESQPSFIKSVEFLNNRVQIIVYFGLAGANGVIPTYLMKMADNGTINDRHFSELIGFFDRYLLKTWLLGMMPERHLERLGQTRWLRAMQNFKSLSSLDWLFNQIFPDLQVRISRKAINIGQETRPAVLGTSKIGIEMILGSEFRVLDYGYEILLIADQEKYKPSQPWHVEIQKRFNERVHPLLTGLELHVDLWMAIRSTSSWFRIEKEGNYLGYERLRGAENECKKILIFSGYIEA